MYHHILFHQHRMQIHNYQNYYVVFFYTVLTVIKTTSSFCSGKKVCVHIPPHTHMKGGNRCEGSISALVCSLSFQRLKILFRRSSLKEGNVLVGRVWQMNMICYAYLGNEFWITAGFLALLTYPAQPQKAFRRND